MARIFLTGATGFVGSHVLPDLLGRGHAVTALARTEKSAAALRARYPTAASALQVHRGDVANPTTLTGALRDHDVVVHLVALARDWSGGADLDRINVGGTAALLDAASRDGVGRFVHLGAMGVEERPSLHYASSKARAERAVRESGLDHTILKPSLMWGARDGFFNIVAALVKVPAPIVPVPGDGKSRFQPIWVGDVARAVAMAIESPRQFSGRSVELGGPRYWTYAEITKEVARALGKRRLVFPMPVPLISLVAGLSEAVRLPFPVATDQLRQLALDNIGATDAVERELGFAPVDMAGRLGYLRTKRSRQ